MNDDLDRTLRDHAPNLERAFSIAPVERDVRLETIHGTVPAYLAGSYYVNGPSRFARGDVRYGHWLDGDGMVCALHFDDEGVRFVNRFVRGTKLEDEEAAGRALYRAFGTAFEGDRLKRGLGLESPLNVSVYRRGPNLLAFGEQGLPYALDPVTLRTREEHTFGGKLNAISPLSAHPHFDDEHGEMFNFGISFSARSPSLTLYRFATDRAGDDQLVYRCRHPLPYACSVHDFGLSPSFAFFYLSPHVLDIGRLIASGDSLMDALDWRPELGSRLIVFAREDGAPVADIAIGDGYCLHTIDGWEDERGHLVADVVELEEPIYDQYTVPDLFRAVRKAQPKRYVVDAEAGRLADIVAIDYERMHDFPAIDPRQRSHGERRFWVLGITHSAREGRKFFDEVVCCDWSTRAVAGRWQAPAGHYLGGEPVFLPDPRDPDAGAIVCERFDAANQASSFLVFDAHDLGRGPVAELPLESPIPLGFHASWAPR